MSKIHMIRVHEHGHRNEAYVLRYTEEEMHEVYSEQERRNLADGKAVITRPDRFGRQSTLVDLEAFFLKTNRFGL